jgi:hypothetical protein
MSDLLESFLESVRVRIKHTEKTRVDLWGQSTILKGGRDVTNGGHVTPKADRCREWSSVHKATL